MLGGSSIAPILIKKEKDDNDDSVMDQDSQDEAKVYDSSNPFPGDCEQARQQTNKAWTVKFVDSGQRVGIQTRSDARAETYESDG